MSTTIITDTVKRVVAGCISRKEWRSSAEQAAIAYLKKPTKAERQAVIDYVRAEYDAAGAGHNGRWQ